LNNIKRSGGTFEVCQCFIEKPFVCRVFVKPWTKPGEKMNEGLYRTGQAARILNVSAHHIRRLCEAGLIPGAQMTDGNRWRLPANQVDRLKTDGIPPIPQIERAASVSPAHAPASLGPRKPEPAGIGFIDDEPAIAPDPAVLEESSKLAIAHRRLQRRRLELETENVEESFREKEKRRATELEIQRQREAEERQRANRKRWTDQWLKFGLDNLPPGVSGACELAVYTEVESTLKLLSPEQSSEVVRQLVLASVRKAIAPHLRKEEQQRAINAALSRLSAKVTSSPAWNDRARRAASEAVRKVGDSAAQDDLVAAVAAAVNAVSVECIHQSQIAEVVDDWGWPEYFNATDEDRDEAKRLARVALADVALGANRWELSRIRDKAVAPVVAKIRARKDRAQQKWNAENLAAASLSFVDSALMEYPWDDVMDRWRVERELKRELQPILVKRLMDGRLDAADVEAFVREWVDDQIEEEDDDEDDDE
jgi:excisionase family DNA binding protein